MEESLNQETQEPLQTLSLQSLCLSHLGGRPARWWLPSFVQDSWASAYFNHKEVGPAIISIFVNSFSGSDTFSPIITNLQ